MLTCTSAFHFYGTLNHAIYSYFDLSKLLLIRIVVCDVLMEVTITQVAFYTGV